MNKSRSIRNRFFIAFICLMAVLVAPISSQAKTRLIAPEFAGLKNNDRITIIAPHPDDETIALGGLIKRATKRGLVVNVIFLTNGDCYEKSEEAQNIRNTPSESIAFGKMRQSEAKAALDELGVKPAKITFLNLPDGQMRNILEDNANTVHKSSCTGLGDSGAYNSSSPITYRSSDVIAAFGNALKITRPTKIFVTKREDTHGDHWAAGQLVEITRNSLLNKAAVYSYLVHYPGFAASETIDSLLTFPKALEANNWRQISLSPLELQAKTRAVNRYSSQLQVSETNFSLRNFLTLNELITL